MILLLLNNLWKETVLIHIWLGSQTHLEMRHNEIGVKKKKKKAQDIWKEGNWDGDIFIPPVNKVQGSI